MACEHHAGDRAGSAHHGFAGQQSHHHGSLGGPAHQGQVGLIHRHSQQPSGAAGHHHLLVVVAAHHPLEFHPVFEFEHGGGPARELLKLLHGQPLEAAIAAQQAQA